MGKTRATASAYAGARELDIHDLTGIEAVILALSQRDFYKSMTTYADHRVWQDLYHARLTSNAVAYVKLTVIDDVLVVSFKER